MKSAPAPDSGKALGKRSRRQAEWRGRWSEYAAAAFLMLKGYRIVGMRIRNGFGEIDILARRGQVLAAVEVKQRSERGAALAAIAPRSQQRIRRAAERYVAQNPSLALLSLRFDAVAITPWGIPLHIPSAWGQEQRLSS